MIPGIDVSHWQSDINWAEVKRSGVKFAFIKATEFPDKQTSLFVDNKFIANVEGAKTNGIYWGPYHFFRTHIDPILQAQAFCETVGEFSSLPPVVDLEVAGSKGERLNYKVRQFLEEVERISSRKPIIYTSSGFWGTYMTCEKREQADWTRFYPLWLAHFTSLWPVSPYPWIAWSFWQYSDKGTLPGIITHVDLNWFTGSEEDLVNQFINPGSAKENRADFIENTAKQAYSEINTVNEVTCKGDYQEDAQQFYSQNSDFEKTSNPESKYSSQEENWIRSYFFNK
jgi:lysozyme